MSLKLADYWSCATNPETGRQFEVTLDYLRIAHNGQADIAKLIEGEYGQAMTELLLLRFAYEKSPMGEAALAYYRSIGLKKEMHEDEDYYTRWMLLTPLAMYDAVNATKRWPLVFMHHGGGNSIESDEFSTGLPQIAAREGFMVAFLQDTNWQNTSRVLDCIRRQYPLDPERVYITGYSQGGYQTTSTYFRIPERFAAAAPCGNDIYRYYDNFNVPYTRAETEHLREVFLPIMQVVGACEASNFVPVNDWHPRKDWGRNATGETYLNPRKNDLLDPTRIIGGHRPFSDMPTPPEGADKHQWMIERLNMRMYTLGCAPRDAERCISYLATSTDELHHVLGFYGDKETTEMHFGCKYYICNIWNNAGMNAFRYVVVENAPHTPPVLMGELVWNFFRQFKRDMLTGMVVVDPYSK